MTCPLRSLAIVTALPLLAVFTGCLEVHIERRNWTTSSRSPELTLLASPAWLQQPVSSDQSIPIGTEGSIDIAALKTQRHLDLWTRAGHKREHLIFLRLDLSAEPSDQKQPALFEISSDAGRLTLVNSEEQLLVLEPAQPFLDASREEFGQYPTVQQWLTVTAGRLEILALAQASFRPDLNQAIQLAVAGVDLAHIQACEAAGFALDADAHIRLKRHRIDIDLVKAWRAVLPEIGVDGLVYARQRHLESTQLQAWKAAGYPLTLEELHFARTRHLEPDAARAWAQTGRTNTLEQLYWLRTRHLTPDAAQAWQRAGYDLTVDELYFTKTHRLSPDEAAAWRKASYDFTLEELAQLRRHRVSQEYAAALADPSYAPLTVDDLIQLRRANVPIETVRQLRARKADPE